MKQWKRLLAVLLTAMLLITMTLPIAPAASAEEPMDDWAFLSGFVPSYNRTWTSSPLVDTENTVNAPVMGNGDMAVAIGGNENEQTYYMRNSDFWSDDGNSINQVPSGVLKIHNQAPSLNLALNKTTSCSSENRSIDPQFDDPSSNAVDGSGNTIWSSKGRSDLETFSEWLMVDLGEEMYIGRYVVKHYGTVKVGADPYNTRDFKLQWSETGDEDGEWTDVDTVTGNTASITDKAVTPFSARYVRLWVTNPFSANDAMLGVRIGEFELYAPDSLPQTTTCSREYATDGRYAACAFDGDDTTYWAAGPIKNDGSEAEWLAIDFGNQYKFNRWVVKHYGVCPDSKGGTSNNTRDFKLQISENGDPNGTWTDVDSVVGNSDSVTDRAVDTFTARYVRLLVTRPADYSSETEIARIVEFKVHKEGESDTPGETVDYHQEEDLLNAEIHTVLPFDGKALDITSYTSANENTMVVELTTKGDKEVEVQLELSDQVLHRKNYPATAGVENDVLWLKRETNNRNGARYISKTAMATRVLGGKDLTTQAKGSVARASFIVEPGTTVTIVTTLKGDNDITGDTITVNNDQHLEDVKTAVAAFDEDSLTALKEAHREWWKEWWLTSYVRTYDNVIDGYYYRMLYQLGTMAREGYVNSGLHGPWITSDGYQNYSSYCSNDLGAAMYYLSLIEGNRSDTAKMWIDAAYDYIPYAQAKAQRELGYDDGSVLFPVHWAPFAGVNYGDMTWGEKWLSSYISLIGEYYYDYTQDEDYLREKIYPLMKASALFYENYLVKEADGKYHIYNCASFEGDDSATNSLFAIGLVKRMFTNLLKYSEILGVDADKKAIWTDIRDNINDFSTGTYNGKTVYLADENISSFNRSVNVIQTQVVYPMDVVNRFSDESERLIGYNTVFEGNNVGGWNQDNMLGQQSFTAALRIGGIDVDFLMDKFSYMLSYIRDYYKDSYLQYPMYTGSGCSLNTFTNNLFVQSYEEGMMFFPDYPTQREGMFKNLQTRGAFLTSGEFRNGTPQNLTITSKLGNECKVVNPWKDADLKILCDGVRVRPIAVESSSQGDIYTFATEEGKTYELERETADDYTVTVENGSGSGDYYEGDVVTVTADTAPDGKVFDKWVSEDVTFANAQDEQTTFTMPAKAVTVTATYKDAGAGIFGDVDGNGKVEANDALLALQAGTQKITLTEVQQQVADVDGEAGVSAADALLILQRATKKIDGFPIEGT